MRAPFAGRQYRQEVDRGQPEFPAGVRRSAEGPCGSQGEYSIEVICQGCQEGLSAEALLGQIMAEVKAFSGGVPQGDNQTVVVLRVEERRGA